MSSGNQGPIPDPEGPKRQPTSELWGPWEQGSGQESRVVSGTQFKKPLGVDTPTEKLQRPANDAAPETHVDPQMSYREHVSGSLASHPSEAPLFQPAYPPYPSYPEYQPQGYPPQGNSYPLPAPNHAPIGGYPLQWPGYPPQAGYPSYQGYVSPPPYAPIAPPYPGYNGYGQPMYGYPWQPPLPKRDSYLLAMGITSLVGSILVLLAGLGALILLALISVLPHTTLNASEYFASIVLFISFACAGVVGGGFGLYHSIRSVFLRKPSADFIMPQFWIFFVIYLAVVGVAYWLQIQGKAVAYPTVTVMLIAFAALFPALTILALGDRRLHFPRTSPWPTSWRRFTLAIVSGATLSVGLAAVLEYIVLLLVHGQATNPLICVDRPNAPNCQDPAVYHIILLIVAVMAPLIEETVKPLAVIIFIGRVRSAAEAFVLGLAAGIGFNLIETTGYISSGYQDWLSVALIRTGSGLLHGFGAAMVTLGWYYLTHPGKHRGLKVAGCWTYAVLQHAIWNGSWGLTLLPGSIGSFFNNTNVTIGSISLPSYALVNIGEAVFMLAFFIYMTGILRTKQPRPMPSPTEKVDQGQKNEVKA
ncbi:MAG: PrsW family intramembrane metalloprotease [Ktedonobacteraceae bacterium]